MNWFALFRLRKLIYVKDEEVVSPRGRPKKEKKEKVVKKPSKYKTSRYGKGKKRW